VLSEQELQRLVANYRVCWEVLPVYEFVHGTRRVSAFELELGGTWPCSPGEMIPSSSRQQAVYGALRAIAENIVPNEDRDSRYELSPFDSAIRFSKSHGYRPDIVLSITVCRRAGEGCVTNCQMRCLQEIAARLSALSASCRVWHDQDAWPSSLLGKRRPEMRRLAHGY